MNKSVSPFDKHVWFDSPVGTHWKELIPRQSIKTLTCLKQYIECTTPWFAIVDDSEQEEPATSRLREQILIAMGLQLGQISELECRDSLAEFLHANQGLFSELGLPSVIPPDDVHRMQRSRYWHGDFYSSNLVLNTLKQGEIQLQQDGFYLDLGCSSGSLLRVLNWYFPQAIWAGCDPVLKSISWARENLNGIQFDCSEQIPPLPYSNQCLDGVIAISVWSHHSESASREWFKEIQRILKPLGWFLFTTHGPRSIYRNVCYVEKSVERWSSVYEGLLQSSHVFEQVWLTEDESGNNATEWGNSYVKPEWIYKELLEAFEIIVYNRGSNQRNQDTYLFRKKVK